MGKYTDRPDKNCACYRVAILSSFHHFQCFFFLSIPHICLENISIGFILYENSQLVCFSSSTNNDSEHKNGGTLFHACPTLAILEALLIAIVIMEVTQWYLLHYLWLALLPVLWIELTPSALMQRVSYFSLYLFCGCFFAASASMESLKNEMTQRKSTNIDISTTR